MGRSLPCPSSAPWPATTSTRSPSAHPAVRTLTCASALSKQASTSSWRSRSTTSMDAASHVVDAQRRTGGTLTVISEHRFDPASLAVHEAIRLGRLGRLTSGLASVPWWRSQAYYDSAGWRGTRELDGGALLNQGIHTIDLLVWFLGIPVEVFAWTGQLAHERIGVEDPAVATLRFPGGVLGVLHAATEPPRRVRRLQSLRRMGSWVIVGGSTRGSFGSGRCG